MSESMKRNTSRFLIWALLDTLLIAGIVVAVILWNNRDSEEEPVSQPTSTEASLTETGISVEEAKERSAFASPGDGLISDLSWVAKDDQYSMLTVSVNNISDTEDTYTVSALTPGEEALESVVVGKESTETVRLELLTPEEGEEVYIRLEGELMEHTLGRYTIQHSSGCVILGKDRFLSKSTDVDCSELLSR